MEYLHVPPHRLLLISMFFILSSTFATEPPISSPGPSPILQPAYSPDAAPQSPSSPTPSPSSLPPLNHVSFPPSGSPAPSLTISLPSSSNLTAEPQDSPDGPQDTPDGPQDSPDGPQDSPDGPQDSPDGPQDSPDGPPDSPAGETPEGPDGEIPVSEGDSEEQEPEKETEGGSEKTEEIPSDVNPEIKKICEQTDHISLCINTINPIMKGKEEVSVDKVLEISIKASNDVGKDALAMTKKLANTPGTPKELTSVLNNCKDSYDDVLYNFERAMEAYDTRDIGTMNTMLSAVITDVGDCDDEFAALNIPSPIAEFAGRLTNMTSNCLAIVSLLPK